MTTLSTRDRRVKTTRHPFGLGLASDALALVRSYAGCGRSADVVEDALWFEREMPTARYTLYLTDHAGRVATEAYDVLADADAMARHWTTPLPELTEDERTWIANETFERLMREDETPACPPIRGGAPGGFLGHDA